MRSEQFPRSYWLVTVCSFVAAAAFVFFAIAMFLEAIYGHGGAAGNILRVGLAVASLFVGLFFLAVGTLYRLSFDDPRASGFR
jgi:hypothetical protein